MNSLYPELEKYIKSLHQKARVPYRRQKILRQVADFIYEKLERDEVAELVFICTHNSRRSHMAQIWTALAAYYHNIPNILTFSGGTEATAFHPNAVATMERAGFRIDKPGGKNPVYLVKFAPEHRGLQSFSKVYADKYNPKSGFCAVMTCAEADEACPVVLGMEKRVSLPYEDPKVADGQHNEQMVYDQRCQQIALEMLFMMGQVYAKKLR